MRPSKAYTQNEAIREGRLEVGEALAGRKLPK
jgi:hypothetical protein